METAIVVNNQPQLHQPSWDTARRWVDVAAKFQRGSVACQVMAGFELLALHEQHQIRRGNFSKVKSPRVTSLFKPLIRKELKIAPHTGYRWMRLAEAFQLKYGSLNLSDRMRTLLLVAPSQWNHDDSSFVINFLHEATNGKSQKDLLIDLGLPKPVKTTDVPSSAAPPENVAKLNANRRARMLRALKTYGAGFTGCDDARVQEEYDLLNAAAQARLEWLTMPKEQRR